MADNQSDIDELHRLNTQFIRNFITCDALGHSQIIHPKFLCISTNGSRQEREEYLRDWETDFDPEIIPYWDTRDERIDLFGDFALVRATNKYVRRLNNHEFTGMTTYTDTYIRDNGKWLCVQAQLTAVDPHHLSAR